MRAGSGGRRIQRRRASGPEKAIHDNERELALLASGSGEIFLAVRGEQVMSSGLVLRSRKGAYYQSAGNSPDGMKLGSSAFLISQIAGTLQQEGICLFNRGRHGGGQSWAAAFQGRIRRPRDRTSGGSILSKICRGTQSSQCFASGLGVDQTVAVSRDRIHRAGPGPHLAGGRACWDASISAEARSGQENRSCI